jgi:single-stranded-DNA-specific exonuclease
VHAFLKLNPDGEKRFVLKEHLDLAALGTVADLVPLLGENRIFARQGLQQMHKSINTGLRALMRVSGMNAAPTTYDCGFRLGPRLNAAGRLESAAAALELLITEDERRADAIAAELDVVNRERRALQEAIFEEADSMARSQFAKSGGVLVVSKEGWHAGVVGIVASKLSQKYHRPAFVIAVDAREGVGKGSGRSIEGFHLIDALQGAREIIAAGGGHHMAVGVTIQASLIPEFQAFMNDWARRMADASLWQRSIAVDLELPLESIDMKLAEELERLGPFGQGNPPVLIALRGVRVRKRQRVGGDQRHLSLVLEKERRQLRSIFFQFDDREDPETGGLVDVVLELKKDEYQGYIQLQGMLRDLIFSA